MIFNSYEYRTLECSFFPPKTIPILEEDRKQRMVIKGDFYSIIAKSHEEIVEHFNSLKSLMFSTYNYTKDYFFIDLKDSLVIDTLYNDDLKIFGVHYVAIINVSSESKKIILRHIDQHAPLCKREHYLNLEYKLNFIKHDKDTTYESLIEDKNHAFYITHFYPDKYLPKYNLDNWKYQLPLDGFDLNDDF
jgi:hypothetical protein